MADAIPAEYLTAAEALDALGIRKQTLYAYVSRGWIRSVLQPGKRERLYMREDIERVKSRSRIGATMGVDRFQLKEKPEASITTSITEIVQTGPKYRGHNAIQLARSGAQIETVAELLWTGIWHTQPIAWPQISKQGSSHRPMNPLIKLSSTDQLFELFASVVLQLGITRGSSVEPIAGQQTLEAARYIIQLFAGYLGYLTPRKNFVPPKKGEDLAQTICRALDIADTDNNREAIRVALILFADHGLSPDAFAARATASSGATLHSGIAAALCASTGTRVGGLYDQLEHFLQPPKKSAALFKEAKKLLDCGMRVPGFGNPLYPKGDPRCTYLLELAQNRPNAPKYFGEILRFVDEMEKNFDLFPRHEFGLHCLGLALALPPFVTGALFALGRTVGWVAHIQEQRLSGMLVPPRAKYLA